MESRSSLHSQLSTIMEIMARSALSQISKLMDEDSTKHRQELSRLLSTNSTLAEKVTSLECELTIVKKDLPTLCKSYRTVGVQTVCCATDNDVNGNFDVCVSSTPSLVIHRRLPLR